MADEISTMARKPEFKQGGSCLVIYDQQKVADPRSFVCYLSEK